MAQPFDLSRVYKLDDLKKMQQSGASVADIRWAYALMDENNERRRQATEDLFALDWKKDPLEDVEELLEKDADLNARDCFGDTPLIYACANNRTEILRLLIQKGADVRSKGKGGRTALHLAAEKGHAEMVSQLIKSGAFVNAQNEKGMTPLHLACKNGHIESAKRLIENGADIEATTENNKTPLYVACAYNRVEMVKWLIGKKANVKVKDENGLTLLYWVCAHDQREMARLLVEKGADIYTVLKEGRIPSMRTSKIVDMLEEIREDMKLLDGERTDKAKEIRSIDRDEKGKPIDHSLRQALFGGDQIRHNAPLSTIVEMRLKERQLDS